MKRYRDGTLMRMTKAELIEMLRVAEHNQDVLEDAIEQIDKNLKDWAPVRHGNWMYKYKVRGGTQNHTGEDIWGNVYTIQCDERREEYEPYCSECHKLNDGSSLDWCPNCGAKMDKEAEYARVKTLPLSVGAKTDGGNKA